jgi:hypothetical protein
MTEAVADWRKDEVLLCEYRQYGDGHAFCILKSMALKGSSNGSYGPCDAEPSHELYICGKPRWNVCCTTVSSDEQDEYTCPTWVPWSPVPMMIRFQPPPANFVLTNSGLNRWRH